MKKKNNRILWSLILAMLVPTLLTGCKKQDLSAQKQNVYAQWEYCLRVQDWICDTVLWALDGVQPFSEEFTWDVGTPPVLCNLLAYKTDPDRMASKAWALIK